jgi:hypothetical protein
MTKMSKNKLRSSLLGVSISVFMASGYVIHTSYANDDGNADKVKKGKHEECTFDISILWSWIPGCGGTERNGSDRSKKKNEHTVVVNAPEKRQEPPQLSATEAPLPEAEPIVLNKINKKMKKLVAKSKQAETREGILRYVEDANLSYDEFRLLLSIMEAPAATNKKSDVETAAAPVAKSQLEVEKATEQSEVEQLRESLKEAVITIDKRFIEIAENYDEYRAKEKRLEAELEKDQSPEDRASLKKELRQVVMMLDAINEQLEMEAAKMILVDANLKEFVGEQVDAEVVAIAKNQVKELIGTGHEIDGSSSAVQ